MEKTTQINVHSYLLNPEFEFLRKGEKTKNAIDFSPKAKIQESEDSDEANFLLCNKCKHPITKEENRIQINEKHQHVFANPHGHVFQIGCFSCAPGCFEFGEKTSYFTWFPGYAWQAALCSNCGDLLGWVFQSKEFQFFGLILDKIKNYNT